MACKQLLLIPLLLLGTQLGVCAGAARDPNADHDLMPGWMGSDYQPPELTPDSVPGRTRKMRVLHADARILYFENFLTPEECDQIIRLAEPRLERSVIVEADKSDKANTTKMVASSIRTSSGMFFARGENDVVKAVEERIAAWTMLPAQNGEGLQVLRYENTQKYDAHWDYFFHKDGIRNGGNRYATVLTYLSDVEEGGETFFPFIPAPGGENRGFSECARKYLAVKPKKGDALLFHSIKPSGGFEKRSMHGACPVIKGTKWSMAKWIHVGRYAINDEAWQPIEQTEQPTPKGPEATECDDLDKRCDSWSLRGECHRNEVWMVGTPSKPGNCLSSCLRCDVWKDHLKLQQGLQAGGVQTAGDAEQKR